MFQSGSVLLGLTLSGTLAAVVLTEWQDRPIVIESAAPPAVRPSLPPTPVVQDTLQAPRLSLDMLEQNPFGARAWFAPPPSPPLTPPPRMELPAPTAPALPYAYLGQTEERDGRLEIYLAQGARIVTAGVGDTLDSQYRLEAVGEGMIELTYLPLQIKQTLAFPRSPH